MSASDSHRAIQSEPRSSGVFFVRHEPNLASGGRVTDTDVEEFLSRTGSSPENLALRALLDKYPGTEKS
jgi:hypothetical protein